MSEEFTPANVGYIDLKNGTRVYVNTDEGNYEKVEGKSLNIVKFDEAEDMIVDKYKDGKIHLKIWHCKVCNLDNKGVICSECKKWYNQADPDCYLKD